MKSLSELYPDADGNICAAFFHKADNITQNWDHICHLADSDDVTFWTVIARHRFISRVLEHGILTVDKLHSSASSSKERISPEEENALIVVLLRLLTTSPQRSGGGGSSAADMEDPVSVSTCLQRLLPQHLVLPVALVLQRHSGVLASIAMTSLFLQSPSLLHSIRGIVDSWSDTVRRLATQCVREAQRGRFQRLSGDILPLFEQAYRHTKQLWALLQSSPFVCDYINIVGVLNALRVMVDIVSPLLQHFAISGDALAPRRTQLSRVNGVIVNAAVNAAATLVLFSSFMTSKARQRVYCVNRIPTSTYESLTEHMLQYVQSTPALLLREHKGTIPTLCHELLPPIQDASQLVVGKVLLSLLEPIPDSKDFSDGLKEARLRFFELLLMELVHQGFHIDHLLEQGFITVFEGERLGASERSIARALAGLTEEDERLTTAPGAAAEGIIGEAIPAEAAAIPSVSTPKIEYSPAVQMVLDVMPHFNPTAIESALAYYNNDVEQMIIDAATANLPPHLAEELNRPAPAAASPVSTAAATTTSGTRVPAPVASGSGAQRAGAAAVSSNAEASGGGVGLISRAVLNATDFASNEDFSGNLYSFISRDLYEAVVGSSSPDNGETDDSGSPTENMEGYVTLDPNGYPGFGAGGSGNGIFDVNEETKERIRVLMEMMYEDERDDGQDGGGYVGGDRLLSDDEDEVIGPNGKEGGGGNWRSGTGRVSRGADAENDAAAATTTTGEAGQQQQQPPRRPPRDDYHDKRYHVERKKRRETRVKDIKATRAAGGAAGDASHGSAGEGAGAHAGSTQDQRPRYSAKQKTLHKKNAGGAKNATTRLFKKGKLFD